MDKEKSLTLQPVAWQPSHDVLFKRALRCDPMVTPATLRANIDAGRALLFDVLDVDGEILGAVVLRVEKRELGAEGVIDAAAGRLPFARARLPALVRAIEQKFYGVKFVRIETASRSIIKAFSRMGYGMRQVSLARQVAA